MRWNEGVGGRWRSGKESPWASPRHAPLSPSLTTLSSSHLTLDGWCKWGSFMGEVSTTHIYNTKTTTKPTAPNNNSSNKPSVNFQFVEGVLLFNETLIYNNTQVTHTTRPKHNNKQQQHQRHNNNTEQQQTRYIFEVRWRECLPCWSQRGCCVGWSCRRDAGGEDTSAIENHYKASEGNYAITW